MKNKKPRLKFVTVMLLVGMLPLLAVALSASIISIIDMKDSLKNATYDRLRAAAYSEAYYFGYEVKDSGKFDYQESDNEYMDSLKEQNIDMTLFVNDERVMSSIKDSDGKRISGTKADADIWKTVQSGADYKNNGIIINNTKFYVYYTPITDSKNVVKGMAFAGEPETKVDKEIYGSIKRLIIAIIVLSALFAAIVVFVAIKIKRIVVSIIDQTHNIADGDLTSEITTKSIIYEINTLIEAAKTLRMKLNGVVGAVADNSNILNEDMENVTNGVETCNTACSGITTAIEELAHGTMDMSASIQNCNTSLIDIGDSITGIATLANTTKLTADNVSNESGIAKKNLDQLITANISTAAVSNKVVDGIHQASDAVERVKEVVSVITNIASETELLSLNASIEAARAGEAGRGFAVVATNIQNLASQSDESAKQIQDMISEIIAISEENVTLAQNIQSAVSSEETVLSKVKDSFDTVQKEIGAATYAIADIADKTANLDKAKVVVLDEISNLSAISEENAASCEETNASMEEVKANIDVIQSQAVDTLGIVTKLSESIAYFK